MILSTLPTLIQPRCCIVLGQLSRRVATANMPVYNIVHSLLSLSAASAICPASSCPPVANTAKTTVPKARTSLPMGPKRIKPASPMLWTSGWRSLKVTRSQEVYVAKAPRNTIKMTPGTMPTTASEDGRESMPLLTISAIMRIATSCHDMVLYLIC